MTAYQSAKWAVGGFSEALAAEVAPLGIKIEQQPKVKPTVAPGSGPARR
jgi:short-subunit dehydrogenase